jgi:hypothetical protein
VRLRLCSLAAEEDWLLIGNTPTMERCSLSAFPIFRKVKARQEVIFLCFLSLFLKTDYPRIFLTK